jgi:outer membrane lipoprotein SlyB
MKASIVLVSIVCAVASSGCMSTAGRTVYKPGQINRAQRLETGTVIGVKQVVIDGQSTVVGLYGGGGIGAAAASGGSGVGGALATAGGAVVGAIGGREIEKAVTRKAGLEITVALDNGDTIIVVQEAREGGFADGDHVRVMLGGNTHVMH